MYFRTVARAVRKHKSMSKPLVSDTLWEAIAPLILPEPPKPTGRAPRVPDRAALAGSFSSCARAFRGRCCPCEMGCGSGSTCWRRLRDWQAAGVWERLHHVLLDRLGRADAIDWSRACVDSASIRAKRGATNRQESNGSRETGHEAPCCGRPAGLPLHALLSPANRNDSVYFEAALDGIRPIKRPRGRPRTRPAKVHADKAYDIPRCHAYLRRRGIGDRIARMSMATFIRPGLGHIN